MIRFWGTRGILLGILAVFAGCGSESTEPAHSHDSAVEKVAPLAQEAEQPKLVIDEQADFFSGRWYGKEQDFFLLFHLTTEGRVIRGRHVASSYGGMKVDESEEDETTISGHVDGQEAAVEIAVGPERDRTVTGVLRREGNGLVWTMRHNAPDYDAIPSRLTLVPQRDSSVSVDGQWYGETDDLHLWLELEERGGKIRGLHIAGDHEGIAWDAAEEGETTVTGHLDGDEAAIEIRVGFDRERSVVGVAVREGDDLLWTMKHNAPDYSIIPSRLRLQRHDPAVKYDVEDLAARFFEETRTTEGGIINGQLFLKGLHLGMSLEEAAARLDALGMAPDRDDQEGYRVTVLPALENAVNEESYDTTDEATALPRSRPLLQLTKAPDASDDVGTWRVVATHDAERRVVRFYFSRKATNKLLQVESVISGDDFKEIFARAYGIPQMQHTHSLGRSDGFESTSDEAWMYRDTVNDWEIVLLPSKTLVLMAMGST